MFFIKFTENLVLFWYRLPDMKSFQRDMFWDRFKRWNFRL